MMLLVGALATAATITIYLVILNMSSLGMWPAFFISWIAVFLAAGGLAAKETAVRIGISGVGRWSATACAALPVVAAVPSFVQLWKTGSGFWFTALLVWLALLAWMSVWVPLQAAEEKA